MGLAGESQISGLAIDTLESLEETLSDASLDILEAFEDSEAGLVSAVRRFLQSIEGLLPNGLQDGSPTRRNEVIEAANEHGMCMVFTNMRHFRH